MTNMKTQSQIQLFLYKFVNPEGKGPSKSGLLAS